MFQLVQNIWLWALAALAVPVVIHLWNTRKVKTLKVGSIVLYSESAKSHARSFKLSELLLLFLRCLLVAVLVLILTKPFLVKEDKLEGVNGWILVEKNSVRQAYQNYKGQMDSLLSAGYRFHYFSTGFEEQAFESALNEKPDSDTGATQSYWHLLKALNRKLPSTLPVYLYTGNQLQSFTANRPAVNLNLTWFTYPAKDTDTTWLHQAYETIDDSIRIVTGHSNTKGSWLTYQTLSRQQTASDVRLVLQEGKTFVEYTARSEENKVQRTEVDTSSFKVAIYSDKYPEDASYIRAAVHAIRDVTRRKITVSSVRSISNIPPERDWLFWLSEETVDPSFLKKNVVAYRKGESEIKHSFILTANDQGSTAEGLTDAYLRLKGDSLENYSEVAWQNGFGEPLLGRKTKGAGIYFLSGRINPRWNDMPWSSRFPQVIYDLLFAKEKQAATAAIPDKRKIDAQQIVPVSMSKDVFPKEALLSKTDLSILLWMLAFGLFLLERIIVHTSKRVPANEQTNGK